MEGWQLGLALIVTVSIGVACDIYLHYRYAPKGEQS